MIEEANELQLLINLWQGGFQAEQAFEKLFSQHYENVFRLLLNLLGDTERVADLTQDVFLVLYRHPPHPAETASLAAWLRRVALNHGYNLLKSEKRNQQHFKQSVSEYNQLVQADPVDEVVRRESRSLVQTILAQLPERQGQLLVLKYSGFSYAEIAATLNIAAGSVGTLLVRAERAFAVQYNRYEQQQPNVLIDSKPGK